MTKFHMHVEDRMIRAGDIKRHPVNQRKSVLRQFKEKLGPFDLGKVLHQVHVVSDGASRWYAVDGATRTEGCQESKEYGPNTMLPCKVYGNGKVPTQSELAELFLLLNTDKILVRASTSFEQAVMAKRPSALAAERLIKKLGPKFQSTTGIWNLVLRKKEAAAERAVNEVLQIWGTKHHIPMTIVSSVSFILDMKQGPQRLKARRTRLRKEAPAHWILQSQHARLMTVGRREGLQAYVVRKLLGREVKKGS